LPIISGAFLAYWPVPGIPAGAVLITRGYDFAQVIDHMAYATEGNFT